MRDIRCDVYTDNFMEGSIEEGYFKLSITNYTGECEKLTTDILLTKESVLEFIEGLKGELSNITQIEKAPFL